MYLRNTLMVIVAGLAAISLAIGLSFAQQPTGRGTEPTNSIVQPPSRDSKHLWRQEMRLPDAIQLPTLYRSVCAGDVNGDGKVDQADLTRIQQSFGKISGDPSFDAASDIDGTGIVNQSDLNIARANIGCKAR